jgi:PAS domain S-box-containing protein
VAIATMPPDRAQFDLLAIPVIHTDHSGVVQGWNHAAEALFGYSAREALGVHLRTVLPEEKERYELLRQRIMAGDVVKNVAVEHVHKEGHRVSVLLSAAPWHADKAIIGIVMTLIDLSTEKARERELAAQVAWEERRARHAAYLAAVADTCHAANDEQAIFHALAECTTDWSDSAGVVMCMDGANELVAFASRTTNADGPIAALFEACAMVSAGASGRDAHATPASRIISLREIPLGGAVATERYHTIAAAPVVVEGGFVATLYAAACGARAPFDETDLATLRSAAALAGRAINRARAYQDLKARLDAREAETRQKDDFLATVSHELRTPLTAILGFAHIIVENDALGPARRRGMAEDIVASGGLLLTQVNDLLDIVQLGAGRLTVAPENVDLTTVIQWCERAVRALMQSKSLRFALAIPPDLPPARANTARLQQVLLNFLVNAYKFTPAGGAVTLEATVTSDSVAISVRDTGIGIAPEHATRIFEPFARIETDYTRTQSGAGVGLAVARQLVDLMGGTIILNSTPGIGSTFTVSLKTATEGRF